MAQFNFMDLNNLQLYDSLIKTYVDTADALAIKYITYDTATNPTTISFWKVDPTGTGATAAYTVTLPDASTLMTKVSGSHNGEIAILDSNGQVTYSSLALSNVIRKSAASGATFTEGQVATFDSTGNAVLGITLADVATSADAADLTFTPGTTGLVSTDVQGAIEELADATGGGVASKTVYITETAGGAGDPYSKRYGIYQGATGSSASPVPAEKLTDIDIPKDMVVESGSVVNIVFKSSDNTLHEGSESGPDVTVAIKGQGVTPTAADAGEYIKLVLANSGSTAIYIKATDLVDNYTGGTTSSGTISISNSNVITFDLDSGVFTLINNSVQKGWSSTTPTSGNLVSFSSNGTVVDSGIAATSVNTDTFTAIADADIEALFE